MNLPRVIYTAILLCALTWCAALFLAPAFSASSGSLTVAGDLLYKFFHPICHQLDDRSFHVLGKPLAVCSRCTSIYLAFLLGAILYPLLPARVVPSRFILLLSIIPMVLDVVAGTIGIHEVTSVTRAITGAMFGLIIPFFVIPAGIEAVTQLVQGSSPRERTTQSVNHHMQKGSSHA